MGIDSEIANLELPDLCATASSVSSTDNSKLSEIDRGCIHRKENNSNDNVLTDVINPFDFSIINTANSQDHENNTKKNIFADNVDNNKWQAPRHKKSLSSIARKRKESPINFKIYDCALPTSLLLVVTDEIIPQIPF